MKMGVACMDEARIKVIRERNLKKKKRNEENYQVSGEVIYSSRANAFDEIVDICDIALSVASIRDKYTEITVSMNEILNTVRCVKLSCGRCNQDVELLLNQIEHLANKCGYHTERR